MIKGISWFVVSVAALVIVTAPSVKAAGDSATAKTDILRPVALSVANEISFGTFVASNSTTGHVTIEPENMRSECTVALCSGTFSPSSFDITGEPGQVVIITHAGTSLNPVTFSMTNGTNMITFGLILHTPILTMSATGVGSFNVGARVRIPANTPAGHYSGSYDLDIEYQ